VKPLLTPRLRMRELREDDFERLHEIWTHPLVSPWIGEHTPEEVREELAGHIVHQREHGYSIWALEERESGRTIGDCGLQPFELKGPEIELAYDLEPDAWGRGYASEAAQAAVQAGFTSHGLERIVAVVKPEHAASRRVLEKAGLRLVGQRPAYGQTLLLYETLRHER
jgi:ribosomal-protein-alanine N-acetyltransferase